MRFVFYLVLLFIFYCIQPQVKENNYYSQNFFSELSEEIRFGRVSPIPFKYTVSSCFSSLECGQNLFDWNEQSIWKTGTTSSQEWVEIDFFSKRLMNKVQIHIPKESPPIQEILCQVLYREEWKTILKTKGFIGSRDLNFSGIDASILRVLFVKETQEPIRISELKIFLNYSILTGLPQRLTGYIFPIEKGLLPEDDYSYPGAPRKYRAGIHKGLDISQFIDSKGNKKFMNKSTSVYSIGDGIIVRADLDYKPMTLGEYNEITTYNQTHPVTFVARDFGGRQIWIDHQNGVMSSYNHLSEIEKNLKVGSKVSKGQVIGKVGNSGLKAEALKTNEQIHLHLEIWVDGEFLGNDLKPEQTKKLLHYFFGIPKGFVL